MGREKIVKVAQKKTGAKKSARKTKRATKVDGRRDVELWLDRVKPELQPIARRIDRLIIKAMPDAVCAVKWNVPFYGLRRQGWIAAINSFKAHVKLLFFGASGLKPKPPEGKTRNAIDFHTDEELDEHKQQVKAWLQQAKKLPGWGRTHRELL